MDPVSQIVDPNRR